MAFYRVIYKPLGVRVIPGKRPLIRLLPQLRKAKNRDEKTNNKA